eukprot:1155245-Pelagomonas_calceolata.AAC.2
MSSTGYISGTARVTALLGRRECAVTARVTALLCSCSIGRREDINNPMSYYSSPWSSVYGVHQPGGSRFKS